MDAYRKVLGDPHNLQDRGQASCLSPDVCKAIAFASLLFRRAGIQDRTVLIRLK